MEARTISGYMPFKIVITETRDVRKILPKRWAVVGQEIARDDLPLKGRTAGETLDKYDYTPETETIVSETVELLSQQVDSLDINAVIKAVNQIK